jgi:hypothetical protein
VRPRTPETEIEWTLELAAPAGPPRRRGRRRGVPVLVLALAAIASALAARPGHRAFLDETVLAAPPTSTAATVSAAPASTAPAPPVVVAPPRFDHPPRVAFFGDSIAVEANPHLGPLLAARGVDHTFAGFGGTATCDYLDEMRTAAEEEYPEVVVIQFTGNALTPCMLERTGGGRGILGDEAGFDLFGFALAYEADTASAIATFGPDVEILLVGILPTRNGQAPPAQIVDDIYRRAAEAHPNVHYVSADPLLAPDGYADQLPCTFVEPCVLGEPVPVRAEDGGHLCPLAGGFCYGGLRMAIAIADAVDSFW